MIPTNDVALVLVPPVHGSVDSVRKIEWYSRLHFGNQALFNSVVDRRSDGSGSRFGVGGDSQHVLACPFGAHGESSKPRLAEDDAVAGHVGHLSTSPWHGWCMAWEPQRGSIGTWHGMGGTVTLLVRAVRVQDHHVIWVVAAVLTHQCGVQLAYFVHEFTVPIGRIVGVISD